MSSVMTQSSLPLTHLGQPCSWARMHQKGKGKGFSSPTWLLPQQVWGVDGGMELEPHSCLCLSQGSWKGSSPSMGLSFCIYKQGLVVLGLPMSQACWWGWSA